MKTILELTDQELNEWVIKEIFNSSFKDMTTFTDRSNAPNYFYPVHNLNHTHLMEEKIREIGDKIWEAYLYSLYDFFSKGMTTRLLDPAYLAGCVHATARQRCEAAYLTFNKESK